MVKSQIPLCISINFETFLKLTPKKTKIKNYIKLCNKFSGKFNNERTRTAHSNDYYDESNAKSCR